MRRKTVKSARPPLTYEELERLLDTGEYFDRKWKLTEEEVAMMRAINAERELERQDSIVRIRADERPLVEALRAAGVEVTSVWDLVNRSEPYPSAMPILIQHLVRDYSDPVRNGIARALAVPEPEVREAWPLLVAEYMKAPEGRGIQVPGDKREYMLGTKDGLACALSASVTDERLPELVALLKNPAMGFSRVLLLNALRKRRKKNAYVASVLEELIKDPALRTEITSWDKRRKKGS